MDAAAIKRVYPTSLMVGLFVTAIFLANSKDDWAGGVLAGVVFALALFRAIESMIGLLKKRNKWLLLAFAGLKYLIVGVFLYFLVKFSIFNIYAFILGFVLVQLVIVLKTIGHALFVSNSDFS